jgi:hypothetical protein
LPDRPRVDAILADVSRSIRIWKLGAVVLVCTGCQSGPRIEPAPAKSAAPEAPTAKKAERFGQPITASESATLSAVLASAEQYRDRTVIMEGLVRRACSRKGCWMELASSADKASPGCRVTFKDYGFFVPTDSAGARAKVQGAVLIHKVEPQWVAHMEEEGAHFASKNADGSANEVRLVATGVELTR